MDNLKYMLSAYFHQDWNHAHKTWEGVIDEFVQDDRPTVAAVPGEIDQLLAATEDDAELSQMVMALGCDYAPTEGDRLWLRAVGHRIQRILANDNV